jgi:hypothetical protein
MVLTNTQLEMRFRVMIVATRDIRSAIGNSKHGEVDEDVDAVIEQLLLSEYDDRGWVMDTIS